MPIRIPNDLPARHTLETEGVMVMSRWPVEEVSVDRLTRELHIENEVPSMGTQLDRSPMERRLLRLAGYAIVHVQRLAVAHRDDSTRRRVAAGERG